MWSGCSQLSFRLECRQNFANPEGHCAPETHIQTSQGQQVRHMLPSASQEAAYAKALRSCERDGAASVTQAAPGNPSWQLVGQHFLPFPCPQNIHVIHSMLYQIPIFARITHPMASLTMHAPILTEKHIL